MDKFIEYIERNYKTVIAWGTSLYYQKYAPLLNIPFDYVVENNESRWGELLDGKEICPPDRLYNENEEDTLIIIFSSFHKEIQEQIEHMGNYYSITGIQLLGVRDLLYDTTGDVLEADELGKEVIVTVSRNNYSLVLGGTSKFIRELQYMFNDSGYIHIHIYWQKLDIKKYQGMFLSVVKNGMEIGLYTIDQFFEINMKIKAFIINNLINFDLDFLNIIIGRLNSSVQVSYYLHDYSCVCTNAKLMYNDEVFCESYIEDWKKCETCCYNEERLKIYDFHKRLFQNERIHLIAPSESTKRIVTKVYNLDDRRIEVVSHQTYSFTNKSVVKLNDRLNIAYVGYMHKHKGWETFKKLHNEFQDRYSFFCMGRSEEIIEGIHYVDVSILDSGETEMTEKLRNYKIDIALLWSVTPETYSYTYYESYAAGSFVLTNPLSGNIADQVTVNNNGTVLSDIDDLRNLLRDEGKLRELIKSNNRQIESISFNREGIMKAVLRDKSLLKVGLRPG